MPKNRKIFNFLLPSSRGLRKFLSLYSDEEKISLKHFAGPPGVLMRGRLQ